MKPHCHNRPEYAGMWVRTGLLSSVRGSDGKIVQLKPVLRYQRPWFEDRCAAWDSGPSPISESVPAREGWHCEGCRWLPGEAGRLYQPKRA